MKRLFAVAFFAIAYAGTVAQADPPPAFPSEGSKVPLPRVAVRNQPTMGTCCDAGGSYAVQPSVTSPTLKWNGSTGEWNNGTGNGLQGAPAECQKCTVKFAGDPKEYVTGIICRNTGITVPLNVAGVYNGLLTVVKDVPAGQRSCRQLAFECARLGTTLGQNFAPKLCYGPASAVIIGTTNRPVVGPGRCPANETANGRCKNLAGKPPRFGAAICVVDPDAGPRFCPAAVENRTIGCDG